MLETSRRLQIKVMHEECRFKLAGVSILATEGCKAKIYDG
jgi:hypothetical protein